MFRCKDCDIDLYQTEFTRNLREVYFSETRLLAEPRLLHFKEVLLPKMDEECRILIGFFT